MVLEFAEQHENDEVPFNYMQNPPSEWDAEFIDVDSDDRLDRSRHKPSFLWFVGS